MKLLSVVLLLVGLHFTIELGLACHPQSRWACDNPCDSWNCDDPVCELICSPICNNTCVCFNPDDNMSYPISCHSECPEDQCESENCPACETICTEKCLSGYDPLCEIPACSWDCVEDLTCPRPECERDPAGEICLPPTCDLVSEMPACMYNHASRSEIFF